MGISAPTDGSVFTTGDTVTFTGSATTSSGVTTTSGLYFDWFSTISPWATSGTYETAMSQASFNTVSSGATALNFTTAPGWGMGTQWIQFSCKDQSGFGETALGNVTVNGIDGGKNTVTLSGWTVNPRVMHVLKSNLVHPVKDDRFDIGTSGDPNWMCTTDGGTSTVIPLYWETRSVLAWSTSTDARTTTSVTSWPGDSAIDDELKFEIHNTSGNIGTEGDAIFVSDATGSTYVWDLDSSHSTWLEYAETVENPSLLWNWGTSSTGTYTLKLIVYKDGSRRTDIVDSVTIDVVA